MSVLKLKLLGQIECRPPSGELLNLSTRKSEVLLSYLAMAPGVRHPRDRLINLLWSDRGEDQARNSLRQSLSSLKKILDEILPDLLEIERTTVCLKAEKIEVDLHVFKRLAAESDIESLSKAVDCYGGEFLQGMVSRDPACELWLAGERESLGRIFVDVLSRLSRTQLDNGEYHLASESAERLVLSDPLGESGWRLLMMAYHHKGDRNHALMAYKRCCEILDKELGVEPEAETSGLQEKIKQGENSKPENLGTPDKPKSESIKLASESTNKDHSIAVLPFDNLSGDPEQEYFSDGITESIILNLSLFPGLQVKSRNSSFAFKEQIKSLGEVSEELNVDYVVEGSIRKASDRIRITVQLIEAKSGNQIWGKRYDSQLENIFDIEEELSRTIATTVTGRIESDLQRIALTKPASHQRSYDLLLAGMYHCNKFTPQDMAIAGKLLDQCLEQDPDNARAHALLYYCHSMNWLERWVEDYNTAFKLAGEHARNALALNPEAGYTQIAYAEYLVYCREFDKAETHVNRALEINPNDTEALTTKALVLENQSKFESALELIELAYELDPYHPWADWILAECQIFLERYEEALETISKSKNAPGFIRINNVVANIRLGRIDMARQALQVFLQECRVNMASMPQNQDEWLRYITDNGPWSDSQINQDMIDCMVQAGLEEEMASGQKQGDVSPQPSIVVLPFDNLSSDPEQEYFSDGITESIILNLSLFPGLQVKSRNSSFAFKQQIKSLGEISEELNVDYVVEGSIRKSDERIRITVQLIEARSGNQIWGKRYDAEIENLFDLEEDLSRAIAATVTGQIESDLQRIAIAKGAVGQKSYDLLLSGTYYAYRFNRQDNVVAIEKLNQCLEQDPDNVRAHALLYVCHGMDYLERWTRDFPASFRLAEEHISKALMLGPELGLVQALYAEYLVFSEKSDEAAQHIEKALDINPNDPNAMTTRALNLIVQGEFEAALQTAERACQLDPYHPWAEWELAGSLFLSGHYETALETIRKSPTSPGFTQVFIVVAYVKLGKIDLARQALQVFLQGCRGSMLSIPKTNQEWLAYTRSTYPFTDPGINQDIVDCLVQAGLEEMLHSETLQEDVSQQSAIVVLPFDNLSGDPEQEYFSDGITESIILGLSSFSGLAVKSRHTSFAYRNTTVVPGEIGKQLGVQYIVEGSIRKHSNQVQITVQLGETSSGNQIWGKRYNTSLKDLFTHEEELVQTIAGTISGRIGKDLISATLRKPPSDMQSRDFLMRGIYHFHKSNNIDSAIAKDNFLKCIEDDPENAQAHAYLAMSHLGDYMDNWSENRQLSIELCQQHVEKALEQDPDNAYAHAVMAELLLYIKVFDRAEQHAEKAIELNSILLEGYLVKSSILAATRRHEEALKYADISLHIDPYHPYSGWYAGEAYRAAGDYERAIEIFRSIPYIPTSVHGQIAACLAGLGKIEEARTEIKLYIEFARKQMPNYPVNEEKWRAYWYEAMSYQYEEDSETLFDLLLKAGLCD